MVITAYDEVTGQIKYIWSKSGDSIGEVPDPYVIGEYDGNTTYISDGKPVERLESNAVINETTILADSTDTAIISNIHNPSTVIVDNGQSWVVTDGVFEFTIDLARVYEITIKSVPYLDKVFTVTAIDAVLK